MSQNQAAQVALASTGGAAFLNLDADGNLLVAFDAGGDAVTIADGADVAEGAKADAAVSNAGTGSVISLLKGLQVRLGATDTVVQSSSGNVAASAALSTLAGAASKTTYLAGLLITGSGATAGGNAIVTVAGLLGGSMTFSIGVPAGATVPIAPILLTFDPPLPASAVNTAITVSAASFGSGNLYASSAAWGFQR